MLKGNHDYWWTTLNSMRKYIEENNFKNIDFIYNNSYMYENTIICGTKGWGYGEKSEDKKLLKRENIRLELSIEDGIKKYGEEKDIIVCMHYPPSNNSEISNEMNFITTMRKYDRIKRCIYGHIHGEPFNGRMEGNIKGIEFNLVSSDYLKFKLIKII